MKTLSVWLLVIASVFGQSSEKVSKVVAPGKVLTLAITIPAPRPRVWQAFTTSDGLSTWLTPGAVVDLRPGGEWTAHFPGGKTGGGTILSFAPEREIVISAMAPEQYPTVRSERTTARFVFEGEGESTTVRLEQTGWKDGEEWDQAYEHLFVGNAQLLSQLHRRFASGPIDWVKEWSLSRAK